MKKITRNILVPRGTSLLNLPRRCRDTTIYESLSDPIFGGGGMTTNQYSGPYYTFVVAGNSCEVHNPGENVEPPIDTIPIFPDDPGFIEFPIKDPIKPGEFTPIENSFN